MSKSRSAMVMGKGILRLSPTWVPRSFCRPGKRIKLHPDDYYALGLERGGIDERWFASTTPADNGPGTPVDEGLSYVVLDQTGRDKVLLRDVVAELKEEVVGPRIWQKHAKWPMFAKFFDNVGPLPHHVHHRDEHAALVKQSGKPEMYFFPAQLNNHPGEFGYTFFGLNPETTREQLKQCLLDFSKGDNKILDLSRCYHLELDTGWDVPPGVLHAPGSLCTYEPQFASDVYAMYQSVLYGGHCVPEKLLWKDSPPEKVGDFDYLVEVLDWALNVDADFHQNRFMKPIPLDDEKKLLNQGVIAEWICYRSDEISAQRITVLPGHTVTIKDTAAHGFILIQGHGRCADWPIETPVLIRFGECTSDEFFVTYSAAVSGVSYTNLSVNEPLVMLRHFAEKTKTEFH
ncbi:MAG: hypothetical protein GX173_03785 [Ruminococcaceae bacterium]|nr:hypothetical protein [Oscillospiraceae bacterium]